MGRAPQLFLGLSSGFEALNVAWTSWPLAFNQEAPNVASPPQACVDKGAHTAEILGCLGARTLVLQPTLH